MILDLVCEAVEIKIHFENFTGVIQSNFELGYAIGKMEKKTWNGIGKRRGACFTKRKNRERIENLYSKRFYGRKSCKADSGIPNAGEIWFRNFRIDSKRI